MLSDEKTACDWKQGPSGKRGGMEECTTATHNDIKAAIMLPIVTEAWSGIMKAEPLVPGWGQEVFHFSVLQLPDENNHGPSAFIYSTSPPTSLIDLCNKTSTVYVWLRLSFRLNTNSFLWLSDTPLPIRDQKNNMSNIRKIVFRNRMTVNRPDICNSKCNIDLLLAQPFALWAVACGLTNH